MKSDAWYPRWESAGGGKRPSQAVRKCSRWRWAVDILIWAAVGRRRSLLYRAGIGSSGWLPDVRRDPPGRQGCAVNGQSLAEEKSAWLRRHQIDDAR
jgi:hypothetical protein